ncbi:MAG TPA: NINE protein [Bacillota bacterium]|nr:NINE protein [Bacillota bacterium]
MKSKSVAYLLWVVGVLGCLGLHRLYLGKKTGFLWMFTGGILGIGAIYDLFSLGAQTDRVNRIFGLSKLANGEDISQYGFTPPQHQEHSLVKQESKIRCPYCKMTLANPAQLKQKCPFCNKLIYLREQEIFGVKFLKKEEAMAVDFMKAVAPFGITNDDYLKEQAQLSKYFMEEVNSADIVYRLFKRLLDSAKDLDRQKILQHSLHLFMKEVGLDFYTLARRAAKLSLLKFQEEQFATKVRIVTAGVTSCPACRRLEGQVFTIEEALSKMPIPCKQCSNLLAGKTMGFCRCEYRTEAEILFAEQWNSSKRTSL